MYKIKVSLLIMMYSNLLCNILHLRMYIQEKVIYIYLDEVIVYTILLCKWQSNQKVLMIMFNNYKKLSDIPEIQMLNFHY